MEESLPRCWNNWKVLADIRKSHPKSLYFLVIRVKLFLIYLFGFNQTEVLIYTFSLIPVHSLPPLIPLLGKVPPVGGVGLSPKGYLRLQWFQVLRLLSLGVQHLLKKQGHQAEAWHPCGSWGLACLTLVTDDRPLSIDVHTRRARDLLHQLHL